MTGRDLGHLRKLPTQIVVAAPRVTIVDKLGDEPPSRVSCIDEFLVVLKVQVEPAELDAEVLDWQFQPKSVLAAQRWRAASTEPKRDRYAIRGVQATEED